ncbi:MAG TPA: alpha/beta fold hydrolase [Thiobacillaceae bacterium]|nr:alpha/beta fold hydrolase [Thiobacillaceae bacterium]
MWRFCVLLLFMGMSVSASATPVTLPLDNGLTARANFAPGRPGKPAVLLLHGYLQTHDFPTIHRMFEALAGEGYTVLAPNLTLNVTHRRQSLACEAIHTHTIQGDSREISAWLHWLGARHRGPVALIGHSMGSVGLLAYLEAYPRGRVGKFIGISIVEGRLKHDESGRQDKLAEMRDRMAQNNRQPVTEQFSFCQKLTATPESLASYMQWSPEHILKAAHKLAVPIVFIMGSRDDRLGPGWTDRLLKTPARVHVVQGANHFMDGEHEFELLDLVLKELADL